MRFIIVVAAYVSLNILFWCLVQLASLGTFFFHSTTFDIFSWGIGILFPLALLGRVEVVLGVWTGHILCFLFSDIFRWTGKLSLVLGIVPLLISLSVAYLFATKVRLTRWKFFAGCWIITVVHMLWLGGMYQYWFARGWDPYDYITESIVASIIQINVLGFVLLQALRLKTIKISRSSVVTVGGVLSLTSAFLPWLSSPPRSFWFLWGVSVGQKVLMQESLSSLVPLILVVSGAFLIILSSRFDWKPKQTLLVGTCLGALGLIAFIFLMYTMIGDTDSYLDFLSYGFPIQLTALVMTVTSME